MFTFLLNSVLSHVNSCKQLLIININIFQNIKYLWKKMIDAILRRDKKNCYIYRYKIFHFFATHKITIYLSMKMIIKTIALFIWAANAFEKKFAVVISVSSVTHRFLRRQTENFGALRGCLPSLFVSHSSHGVWMSSGGRGGVSVPLYSGSMRSLSQDPPPVKFKPVTWLSCKRPAKMSC